MAWHGFRGVRSYPYATGAVNRRLNALLRAGTVRLSCAEVGLLRALISLADWTTGEIPASLDQIAPLVGLYPTTVSKLRVRLREAGLIEERWRSTKQVQYALTSRLRKPSREASV